MSPKKKKPEKPSRQGSFELVRFAGSSELGAVDLSLDATHDTMWASIEKMSQLFGRKPHTITKHIRNIFRDGELDEASVARKFRAPAKDGKNYKILHYNLDVIISVGYRESVPGKRQSFASGLRVFSRRISLKDMHSMKPV